MARIIDLDEMAQRLQPTVEKWRQDAHVGPLTWRDAGAKWSQSITDDRDRASIDLPESLGLHVTQGDDEILVCQRVVDEVAPGRGWT